MKERPILFSAPMVRAILEGRKTMTRRVLKTQPIPVKHQSQMERLPGNGGELYVGPDLLPTEDTVGLVLALKLSRGCTRFMGGDVYAKDFCPYGVPGDRLWVRETHYAFGWWMRNGRTKKGNQKWTFVRVSIGMPIQFDRPVDVWKSRDKSNPETSHWYERRARFMPKSYARIWLEISSVRVERLNDITWEDAEAEGIQCVPTEDEEDSYWCVEPNDERGTADRPDDVFSFLWESINGRESWDANPWVWVVEFRRVEK